MFSVSGVETWVLVEQRERHTQTNKQYTYLSNRLLTEAIESDHLPVQHAEAGRTQSYRSPASPKTILSPSLNRKKKTQNNNLHHSKQMEGQDTHVQCSKQELPTPHEAVVSSASAIQCRVSACCHY